MKWILVFFTIGELANAQVSLRLRPHVVVGPESEVTLAQLTDAQGISPESEKQLREIVLSRAPAFGERQELAGAGLSSALRPIVEAERARGAKVQTVIPKFVIVDTVKREISRDQVATELLQAWQPLCTECKLEIEGVNLPQINGVRDWTLRIKAELPRGSFSLPVEIVKENGQLVPAWITGRVLVKRKVPVTKRLMAPGEFIGEHDIAWEHRDTSFSMDASPTQEELQGKRLKQGLRSGDIVWRGNLEKEKAIRRGELVTVRSGEGMWEVSINLIAQQDAYIGDTVNLKNPRNNAPFVGLVTGLGEVNIR